MNSQNTHSRYESSRVKYARELAGYKGELVGVDHGVNGREGPTLHIIQLRKTKGRSNYHETSSMSHFNDNTKWRFNVTSRENHEFRRLLEKEQGLENIEYASTIRHDSLWTFYDYIGYDRKKRKILTNV